MLQTANAFACNDNVVVIDSHTSLAFGGGGWGGGGLCSLAPYVLLKMKVFCLAPHIPKINSASPQIPKNISQFSLKLSVGLNSRT